MSGSGAEHLDVGSIIDPRGYPVIVMIERGRDTVMYHLTGDSLDVARLDWRTRAFLRAFARRLLDTVPESPTGLDLP